MPQRPRAAALHALSHPSRFVLYVFRIPILDGVGRGAPYRSALTHSDVTTQLRPAPRHVSAHAIAQCASPSDTLSLSAHFHTSRAVTMSMPPWRSLSAFVGSLAGQPLCLAVSRLEPSRHQYIRSPARDQCPMSSPTRSVPNLVEAVAAPRARRRRGAEDAPAYARIASM